MQRKHKNSEISDNKEFQFGNTKGDQSQNYIKDKLGDLELIADELIRYAVWLWEKTHQNKNIIFKEIETYLT